MVTSSSDKKVLLEKFELDEEELIVANKIIDKRVAKIQRYVDYEEIKLEMKVRQKGKNKQFQIIGRVIYPGGKVVSEKENINPFIAINEVLEKLEMEIKHKLKENGKK